MSCTTTSTVLGCCSDDPFCPTKELVLFDQCGTVNLLAAPLVIYNGTNIFPYPSGQVVFTNTSPATSASIVTVTVTSAGGIITTATVAAGDTVVVAASNIITVSLLAVPSATGNYQLQFTTAVPIQ